MKSLVDLCNEFKSDKEWYHGYISGCYERFLNQLRDEPIDLLEIGVFGGASMRMWSSFFHNAGSITGLDIVPPAAYAESAQYVFEAAGGNRPLALQLAPLPESVCYCQLDAYLPETVEGLAISRPADKIIRDAGSPSPGWDIIIDDGPHTHESQVFFWRHYAKLLKPGGLLFLEDIAFPHTVAELREIRKPIFMMDKSQDHGKGSDSRLMVWRND